MLSPDSSSDDQPDKSLPDIPILWRATLALPQMMIKSRSKECLSCGDSGMIDLQFCLDCDRRPLMGSGRYQLLRRLGEGSWACVFLAMDLWLRQRVAIKVYAKGREFIAMAEVEHLRRLQSACPTVPRFYSAFGDSGGNSLIIQEWLQPIDKHLFTNRVELVRRMAYDVGSALSIAHQLGVVHGDVKRDNVLWHPDRMRFILADWSNAIPRDQLVAYEESWELGSLWYRAPECLLKLNGLTPLVDCWSLGILLLEQFCQFRFTTFDLLAEQAALFGPFPSHMAKNENDPEWFAELDPWLRRQVRRQSLMNKCSCPADLASFLADLLDPDPSERLSSTSLLQHPFLFPCK